MELGAWCKLPLFLFHKNFWDPQLARTERARDLLASANARLPEGEDRLPLEQINEVLREEQGETLILKRAFDNDRAEKRYIRGGRYIALAEMFHHGCLYCSCHALYAMYLGQPIFVTKRAHSQSQS